MQHKGHDPFKQKRNFGPKPNGLVRSNRKIFEKTGSPFEVEHFSRSNRSEFWLNGSREASARVKKAEVNNIFGQSKYCICCS